MPHFQLKGYKSPLKVLKIVYNIIMITHQSQIKINLPVNLKEYIESKARKFGMPLAAYVKHLILKDVEDMEYPVFELSERSEKAYNKALKDEKEGKLLKVENLEKFFDEL